MEGKGRGRRRRGGTRGRGRGGKGKGGGRKAGKAGRERRDGKGWLSCRLVKNSREGRGKSAASGYQLLQSRQRDPPRPRGKGSKEAEKHAALRPAHRRDARGYRRTRQATPPNATPMSAGFPVATKASAPLVPRPTRAFGFAFRLRDGRSEGRGMPWGGSSSRLCAPANRGPPARPDEDRAAIAVYSTRTVYWFDENGTRYLVPCPYRVRYPLC